MTDGFAAIVLAGGAARRMGGVDKPAVRVADLPMLDRVLAAASAAAVRVVVGPVTSVPAGVLVTREQPPGGGPVAATAAGLAVIDAPPPRVALLAADLPLLTPDALALLSGALDLDDGAQAALYLDGDGRRQHLCGMWRTTALAGALERLAARRDGALAGCAVRHLLTDLTVAQVRWTRPGPPPWFDCDTDEDVRRAGAWIH